LNHATLSPSQKSPDELKIHVTSGTPFTGHNIIQTHYIDDISFVHNAHSEEKALTLPISLEEEAPVQEPND
jgi:hypothetical protein